VLVQAFLAPRRSVGWVNNRRDRACGLEKPTVSRSDAPTAQQPAQPRPERRRAPDSAPVVLGRYRLHRRLGAGAFGTVWLARDERLDRDVAVKIIPRERVIGGRFEREARAAARLSHPGIVTLYEAGADDDGAYLVSELVRGTTLDELLAAGRLSDRDIVKIGIALCDALAHAHAQGVVHRDVKPSNILVPEQTSTPAQVAKLTDFGVARVVGGDSLTRTGDIVGTAAYMAPEQAAGREAGAQADVYALALVVYEALTGVNPVRLGTAAQRARRLGAHLSPLRRQRRDLPRELGQGIDLALRPRPRERGSIEELRAALSAALAGVEDEPGIVTGRWGLRPEPPDPQEEPLFAPSGHDQRPDGHPDETLPARQAALSSFLLRVLSALATFAATGWLISHLLHSRPIAPLLAGVIAGGLVFAFPRLGWLTLVATLSAWLSMSQQPGAALVFLLAALIPVGLTPLAGREWSLAAGAPALGLLSLAGAWPAVAARAGTAWRRAVLGATGWIWTVIAERLAGVDLYLGTVPGTSPPGAWTGSLDRSVHDVLGPIASSGAWLPALVWAAAAVVLPWLVRGRSFALDAALVSLWSVFVVVATTAALGVLHGPLAHRTPHTAVIGAAVAVLIALSPHAARALGRRRAAREPRAAQPGLP
jgi:serine/threonine protein kinase